MRMNRVGIEGAELVDVWARVIVDWVSVEAVSALVSGASVVASVEVIVSVSMGSVVV